MAGAGIVSLAVFYVLLFCSHLFSLLPEIFSFVLLFFIVPSCVLSFFSSASFLLSCILIWYRICESFAVFYHMLLCSVVIYSDFCQKFPLLYCFLLCILSFFSSASFLLSFILIWYRNCESFAVFFLTFLCSVVIYFEFYQKFPLLYCYCFSCVFCHSSLLLLFFCFFSSFLPLFSFGCFFFTSFFLVLSFSPFLFPCSS